MFRPNSHFIQVDQLNALALRPYGDTVYQAPMIDGIAARRVTASRLSATCRPGLALPLNLVG